MKRVRHAVYKRLSMDESVERNMHNIREEHASSWKWHPRIPYQASLNASLLTMPGGILM
jgi:hypothetical protein